MRSTKLLVGALVGALISTSAMADGSVATVNGVAIPQSKMDMIVKQLAERGQKDSPELRDRIKQQLVTNEVLYQDAVKKGVDKSADVQSQLDAAKQQIVVSTYVNNFVKANPVSDADVQKEYDRVIKANFAGKEYHARHILVKTEAEANDILAQLKKGKKFDDLAKAKSIDTQSGAQGGDLGWSSPTNYVPEFSAAMTKLTKGQITQTPVKTQFGYHIIKLEDVRDAKAPPLDQVKGEISQQLERQKVEKMVSDLRAKATVQ
ncbi:peptidyl-prolyl cis-trans isomerase C [Silvimonas terrae]|uniref:peptidylprolyl isomerase n=1 Tax=Silvimonas terrae TaxID=300266 RepID=A0A840RDA1_9NEIS|nr:peptidylprolyl isomerase [Silvimonas terrae]MBB5190340.1 peptidyl-prolyl cis-trans isomerase C [Silvimonas terrae]